VVLRPREGVCGGVKIFGSTYYSQRAVFASLGAFSLILFLWGRGILTEILKFFGATVIAVFSAVYCG